MEEPDFQNEENNSTPFMGNGFNKALAILFVLGIYMVIFLKILFIR
jgi:hypothetical protein